MKIQYPCPSSVLAAASAIALSMSGCVCGHATFTKDATGCKQTDTQYYIAPTLFRGGPSYKCDQCPPLQAKTQPQPQQPVSMAPPQEWRPQLQQPQQPQLQYYGQPAYANVQPAYPQQPACYYGQPPVYYYYGRPVAYVYSQPVYAPWPGRIVYYVRRPVIVRYRWVYPAVSRQRYGPEYRR